MGRVLKSEVMLVLKVQLAEQLFSLRKAGLVKIITVLHHSTGATDFRFDKESRPRLLMGVDHGERKEKSPKIWSGDTNAPFPPQIFHVSKFQAQDCPQHQHIGTKRSVL